jgi:hypothetical protein
MTDQLFQAASESSKHATMQQAEDFEDESLTAYAALLLDPVQEWADEGALAVAVASSSSTSRDDEDAYSEYSGEYASYNDEGESPRSCLSSSSSSSSSRSFSEYGEFSIQLDQLSLDASASRPATASRRRQNGTVDRRRRKVTAKLGVVHSSITSRRMKPAATFACADAPSKDLRVKGAVYVVGDERKKWDGRQWRRVCAVEGCCSAARGTTEFCIVHGRDEDLAQLVQPTQPVQLALPSDQLVLEQQQPLPAPPSQLQQQHMLSRKRFSDDYLESPTMKKTPFDLQLHVSQTCLFPEPVSEEEPFPPVA